MVSMFERGLAGDARAITRGYAGQPMNDVVEYFNDLQQRLLLRFEQLDGHGKFFRAHWTRPGGEGLTAVLEGGATFERAGASFSDISGTELPPSATAAHP